MRKINLIYLPLGALLGGILAFFMSYTINIFTILWFVLCLLIYIAYEVYYRYRKGKRLNV